jgi:hypothetical protein
MVHSLGLRAARELMTIGWARKRRAGTDPVA